MNAGRRWLLRTLQLCWGMTWRTVIVTALGGMFIGVTGEFLTGPTYLGRAVGALGGLLLGMFVGPKAGLLLGLVTRLWLDAPAPDPRRGWVLRVVGMLAVPLLVAIEFAPHYVNYGAGGGWRSPGDSLGGWGYVVWLVCGYGACGWLAGHWAAGFHRASRPRGADEDARPGR